MIQPRITDAALMTDTTVIKTFNNEDAFMYARIEPAGEDLHKKTRAYVVRTDLAIYKPFQLAKLDANGDQVFESDGTTPVMETKQVLTVVEQKQDWSPQVITYSEIDAFSTAVASKIPAGLTKTERELLELKLVFLAERKKNKPYGVAASKWRLSNENDLIK